MSELLPGAGYEDLPETQKRFVDYVNNHAREEGTTAQGQSDAGRIYNLSDKSQFIPFDRVIFRDVRLGGLFVEPKQKDAIEFYYGERTCMMMVLHEFGYGSPADGFALFIPSIMPGSRENFEAGEVFINSTLDKFVELEEAKKMTSANQ